MQLLIPMITLAAVLPAVVFVIFTTSYEQEIYSQNEGQASLMAEEIATFMDGAYHVNEVLADNPSILTMDTSVQTPILEQCVERNPYLDQIYIQGTDGMQTGRSSGELADRSTRWWFQQMMEQPEAFISKSYYSVATGMPCASVFFPMYQGSALAGIYAADLKLDFLQDLIGKYSSEAEGRISFVIDGEGVVVAHPDLKQVEEQYDYKGRTRTVSIKDEAGNPVMDEAGNIKTEQHPLDLSTDMDKVVADAMAGSRGSRKIGFEGDAYYASYTAVPLPGSSDSWSLITLQERGAAMAVARRMLAAAAILSLAAVAAAVVVVGFLARRLAMPVVSITGLMKGAADGDFSAQAPETSQDEVGALARSYNTMSGRISGALMRIRGFTADLLECSDNLQALAADISSVGYTMKEISDGTTVQSSQVGQAAGQMSRLEGQFGELKEKSVDLLHVAEQTMRSGEEGRGCIKELEAQNRQVEHNVGRSCAQMKVVKEHSLQISEIVGTMKNIASETELLALNASIEAARAGEHGKGFSVVAESIGKLAADASKAAADIGDMVAGFCKDMDSIAAQVDDVREITAAQIQAAQKAGEVFLSFQEAAGQTSSFAADMDSMIGNMYEIDRFVADALQRISDIAKKAEGLSGEVSVSLDEKLKEVQNSAESITGVSSGLEQEMAKFKL